MPSDATRLPRRDSPYVGLASFGEEDAEFFFGRDKEISLVVSNLRASRLTLLYGGSGVGKSSILSAGAVHRLRELAERNQTAYGSPEFAVVVFRAWQVDPLDGLKDEARHAAGMALGGNQIESDSLVDVLRICAERAGGELFVVLDQFEEFFRYSPGAAGPRFAEELAEAVNAPGLRVNFLLSIREDALAKLDRFKGLIPNLYRNTLRIPPLDREAATEAIECPVLRFRDASESHVEIEPALVSELLDQIGLGKDAPEPGAAAQSIAPLLQLVMTRLWEEERRVGSSTLRLETLVQRVRGAEGIVERHVDERIGSLSERERELAASLFDRLVTPSGEKVAHAASDLSGWADGAETEIAALLERLAGPEYRILRPTARGRYEIYHDVLGPPILAWLFEHRAETQLRAERRSSRAKLRAYSLIALVLTTALSAAVALALITAGQRRFAEKQTRIANAGRLAGLALLERGETGPSVLRSALLAVESMKIRRSLLGDRALREVLELLPEPIAALHHDEAVGSVAASAAGALLATTSSDNTVTVWDSAGWVEYRRLAHTEDVVDVTFSPDAATLATLTTDRTVHVWIIESGIEARRIDQSGEIRAMTFDPTGKLLACAGHDSLTVWDPTSGQEEACLEYSGRVFSVSFSPNGSMLAAASIGRAARLWDTQTWKTLRSLPHDGPVNKVDFSPDGTRVVTTSMDNTARVWDSTTGTELIKLMHEDDVGDVAFSPDGRSLATISDDLVRVWDAHNGTERARFTHDMDALKVEFSSDGKKIATTSYDATVRVWDIAEGEELARLVLSGTAASSRASLVNLGALRLVTPDSDSHVVRVWSLGPGGAATTLVEGTSVGSIEFSPDGELVAAAFGSDDAPPKLWSVETPTQFVVGSDSQGQHPRRSAVSFSPDGQSIATASRSGVRMWDVESGAMRLAFSTSDDPTALEYSPDGASIVTAGGRNVRVWSAFTGGEVLRLEHDDAALAVSFSPSGEVLASGGWEDGARVWDLGAGKELLHFQDGDIVPDVSVSPDGATIATASYDGIARIWDLRKGNELASFFHSFRPGYTTAPSAVFAVSFSPDGKRLATGGSDGTARIWDIESGGELVCLSHGGMVDYVSYSPDGSRLATAGGGSARLWLVTPQALIDRVCAHLPQNFTQEEWDQFFPGERYRCTCENLPSLAEESTTSPD